MFPGTTSTFKVTVHRLTDYYILNYKRTVFFN